MPAKKPSKAEQERAEVEAAVAKAAVEQAAAEADAAASSLDALFTYDPALVVPLHDDADISSVLRYHFHSLYHPKPPATAAPPQPAAVESKEQQPPPQPTRGAGKSVAKASKPGLKKQPSVAVEVAPPVVQPVVLPVGRADDHPISVLEREWKADEERYRNVESSLLAAFSAHTSQQQQLEAQLQSLQLLPSIDFPHPPSIPPSPAASIESSERLINLSALTSSVVRELLQRQRPIVRRMPDVMKRPTTRGGSAQRVEQEEEAKEQLTAAQAKQVTRRRAGKGNKPPSDRQLVQRELNRIALAPSQLEVEQRLLRRMREKQRYLANPRSQPSAQHQPSAQQHMRGLEADVSDIRFLRYDRGERYERTVRLTNSSHLTQRLSMSQPPVGSPFAYTLSSVAAAASLASGMSVSVMISFAPSSLASASTVLAVRTEHQSVHIPIVAQRLPSPLSLPPAITLPACLLQRTVVQRVEVRNEGLRSTFRLLAGATVLPLEQLQPTDQLPSTLRLSDALSVYPAVFELDEGDSITLTLTFAPTAANAASASSSPLATGEHGRLLYTYGGVLAVVTDDGVASYHTVSAEACELALRLVGPVQQPAGSPALVKPRAPFLFGVEQVGLTSASPTASSALHDPIINRLLFPSTLLGSSSAVSVTLCNLSPVSLPFQWLTPFDDRYSSLLPVFHCYPFNGTLHGYEEREMVVTFTPRAAQSYTHSLQLLCNEPGQMDLSVAEMAVEGQGRAGRLTMAAEGSSDVRVVQRGEWEVWQLRLSSAEPDDVDVEYDVTAAVVSGSAEASRVQLWPSQGLLSGGQSRSVSVNVQSDECGEVAVEVKLAVHPGGLCAALRLTASVVERLLPHVDVVDDRAVQQQEQVERERPAAGEEQQTPRVVDMVAASS